MTARRIQSAESRLRDSDTTIALRVREAATLRREITRGAHVLAAALTDFAGQSDTCTVDSVPGCRLNVPGWKYVELPVSKSVSRYWFRRVTP